MAKKKPEKEFSRMFALADLGEGEAVVTLVADSNERVALARRFGVAALEALTATVRLKRENGGAVRLRAHFVAEVTQACVVTLEPVASRIDDDFEVLFAPEAALLDDEIVISTANDDVPEPLADDSIDLGEVIAEHFGLALDPYPRRAGAVFTGSGTGAEGDDPDRAGSPFAAIRKLSPGG
ncbi:MAG: DUF177 domain-containing protein [Alphaproteobacteria bacterium]